MSKEKASERAEIIEDWRKAKGIIEQFMVDLGLKLEPDKADHNSSALIARLSQAGLAVSRYEHLKED